MADKKLDFNAPLLSVRRFSSKGGSSEGEKIKKIEDSHGIKPYLPSYNSELKSGPQSNAGAVPFTWEQIPGRPKDEGGPKFRSLERPAIAPKLPPGRTSEVKYRSSEDFEEKRIVIRPQNDIVINNRPEHLSLENNVTKLENSKEGMNDENSSDSDEGDDAFADALDTLSRSESLFFNCSVSGVSGLDGSDVKPSGIFVSDPQTRDFMMGRFLPAAKAMASETPQHGPRRQPVAREQPRQMKKVVNGDRRYTYYQYRLNNVPYVQDTLEEESEDEDDDYSDTGNLSKACGLLPRFCLKNSLCLLNPVPGMKVRTRSPLPSVRRNSLAKTASSGSHSSINDENNWEAVYKHKLMTGLRSLEDESKLTSESNQLTLWSDSQSHDGSSPNIGSVGGGISPYKTDIPQSPFHEGRGFLGTPKHNKNSKAEDPHKDSHINFQGRLSHLSGKRGSGSLSPTVEKTLYVDSEHAVQTSKSNLSSSDTEGMMCYAEKDPKILTKSTEMEDTTVAVSCVEDMKNLIISKERSVLQPKVAEVVPTDSLSSSDRSNPGGHKDGIEGFRKEDGYENNCRSLVCLEVATGGNQGFDKPQISTADDQGESNLKFLSSPLPPPLPKSPSESWLWRTLPSISSRNGVQFHPRKLSIKTHSVDPKWETIVKTSNVHHGHLRFSEELTTPLPQQSET